MEAPKTRKSRLFDLKLLPMDIGRFVFIQMNLWFRIRRLTTEGKRFRRSLKGPHLIACNHISYADPMVLGAGFWFRRVRFLASETVMRGGFRTWLMYRMGCIRIDRNISDLEAIRKCIDTCRAGMCLGMFPEGTIHRASADNPPAMKSGAILIAVQSRVPILPVYIHRPAHWYNRWTMVVGEPFDAVAACGKRFPSVADLDRAAAQLTERMRDCANAFERWKEGR